MVAGSQAWLKATCPKDTSVISGGHVVSSYFAGESTPWIQRSSIDPATNSWSIIVDNEQPDASVVNMYAVVIVHVLDDLDSLFPTIAALSERHTTYGLEYRHFDTVGEALQTALAATLREDFTAEVGSASADAYTLVASVMRRALVRAQSSAGGTTGESVIDRG